MYRAEPVDPDEEPVGSRFGLPYDEDVYGEIVSHPDLKGAKFNPERRIKLEGLRPSQRGLKPEKLQSLFHDRRPHEGHAIHVINLHGENVIWNGHHRIADAMAKGQKTVKARYQELD